MGYYVLGLGLSAPVGAPWGFMVDDLGLGKDHR